MKRAPVFLAAAAAAMLGAFPAALAGAGAGKGAHSGRESASDDLQSRRIKRAELKRRRRRERRMFDKYSRPYFVGEAAGAGLEL